MAKWGEIKCPRCDEQDALWEGMERALEESDAREATLSDRITMLEEHLCLTEEKLVGVVEAASDLRAAQRAYMADRGNDALGAEVGGAATRLDATLAAIRAGNNVLCVSCGAPTPNDFCGFCLEEE